MGPSSAPAPDRRLLAVLALATVIFVLGVQWGLPNDETWEPDSLAPYHPLVGLSQLFSFGYFHKYPVVHQWLLALLDLPVVIAAVFDSVRQGALDPYALLDNLTSPRFVTPILVLNRLASAAMAVATVLVAYRLTRELASARAAVFSALFVALSPALNRYAHVAKVEVPHVLWALLSIHALVRAVSHGRKADYALCALYACLSFGSKDQAYAIFVLPFIVYFVLYPARFGQASVPPLRRVASPQLGAFALAFVLGTLWVQNVLLNPSGLLKRIAHLTGDAGFRSVAYSFDVPGVLALAVDYNKTLVSNLGGPVLYLLALAGALWIALDRSVPLARRLLQLAPLCAAASSYLFFVQIIRQSTDRFALFSGVVLALYAGIAADRLLCSAAPAVRRLGHAAWVLGAAHAFALSIIIDIDLWTDVRYDAEHWLRTHAQEGASIEYYSSRHYMPRLPSHAEAYQVRSEALGVSERKPDYIVLSSLDYARYLGTTEQVSVAGRLTVTARKLRDRTQSEFPEFYRKLFGGELAYREVARFERTLPFSRTSSVPQTIAIYRHHDVH